MLEYTNSQRKDHVPYVITTISADVYADRRAVATLDEAREAASTALWENGAEPDSWRLDSLTEDGGTMGPLPDGIVVEVKRVSWDYLTRDMPEYVSDENIDAFGDDIIAAFNAD